MPFRLRDGMSWCECSGRAVFLDRDRDRYFVLPEREDRAFRRWASGGEAAGEACQLDRLASAGVITCDAGEISRAAPAAIVQPTRDLAAESKGAGLLDIVRAVIAQKRAEVQVRRRRLADILASVEAGAGQARAAPGQEARASRIAAGFAAAASLVGKAELCLPRALAAYATCRRHGVAASIVFGVRIEPFAAHCWVQHAGAVIVGDLEETRLFTPILVLP